MLGGIHLYGSTGIFIFWHRAVEGLVQIKLVYRTTISQQGEKKVSWEMSIFFLINSKAPHGQAMVQCGL